MWPFAVLGICLVAIVFLVTVVRLHAFFALIVVALLAGLLTEKLPGEYGTLPATPKKERSHWVQAAELTTEGFGNIAAKIGVVIALASVIGTCLVESGGADKVVRRFLALFGEKRAAHALFASSYLLSIPIFFETFFMLLLPMAKGLRLRTGRNYMLFVLAICCGGTVTHSLVAPHPGPLGMAENLHLDVGLTIVVGRNFFPSPFVGLLYILKKEISSSETISLKKDKTSFISFRSKNFIPPKTVYGIFSLISACSTFLEI